MRIGIQVTGFAKVRGAYAALGQRARNLSPALLRGGVVILTDAQQHIRDGGPGWPPTVETSMGSALYRTGALFRSLQVGGEGNIDQEISGGIRVGTNLMTPDGRFSIGRLMQYGTGPIRPVHAKLLVFEVNGQKIFSRGTKGIPPRWFLYVNSQTAERVRGVFANYIMGQMGGTLA